MLMKTLSLLYILVIAINLVCIFNVWTPICVCSWVNAGMWGSPWSTSFTLFETVPLFACYCVHQTDSLVSLLGSSCLTFQCRAAGIINGGFLGSKLRSSHLCDKHFTHGTIILRPVLVSNIVSLILLCQWYLKSINILSMITQSLQSTQSHILL